MHDPEAVLPVTVGQLLSDLVDKDYSARATERSFWRRADRARHNFARGVDADGRAIMPAHPAETADRYATRLAMAIARPYVRSIINRYNDFVTRHEVERPDGGPQYDAIVKDATGNGKSLESLMKERLRKAQVEGVSYLLCDSLRPEAYPTAAAAASAGQRGVIRAVDADSVLASREVDGIVTQALILLSDMDGDFLWNVDSRAMQRISIDTKGDTWKTWKVTNVGEEIPHNYKGCPLVALNPEIDEGSDESQAAPIAESMRRICNLDSWHFEELQNITFTTTVLLGISAESVKNVEIGPGKVLCLPAEQGGSNPSIGKISADVSQADSLRRALADETKEMYRAAGLAAGNPLEVGQPESGVAKAFAFDEVAARLKALADAAEAAENLAIRRLANDGGWTYPGDAQWPDEFDAADLGVELERVIRLESASAPRVLVESAWRDYAEVAHSLSGEEKARLESELAGASARSTEVAASPFINPISRTAET
jgi:hypothetical protein